MSTTTKESINLLRLGDDYPHDCLFAELSAVSPDGFLEDKDSNEHDGDSLDSLTNKYGKPASLTLARINGKVQTNAVWHNTNGGANGTVSVDFSEQNTATDKKQEKLR